MNFALPGRPGAVAGICLLLFALPCIARGGVRPGIEGGANVSSLSYDDDDFAILFDHWDRRWRPSFTGGLTLELPIRGNWALFTGLRYVQEGNLVKLDFRPIAGPVGEFRIHAHYLALPVRAAWRPFPSRRLLVAIGPEVALLVAGQLDYEYTWPEASSREDDIVDDLDRVMLALGAETGLEFPLEGHTGCVTLRYSHGLTSASKTDQWVSDFRTRGVECLLGMKW